MDATNSTRKILVVRRENIGDLILTTPLIRLLREQLPSAYVAALVNSYNAPVLDQSDDLDEIFVYTKGKHADSWWGTVVARYELVRLFLKLRRMQFDDVILAEPTYTPRNIRLARFIIGKPWSLQGQGGRRVIGFEHDDGAQAGLDVVVSKSDMAGLHQTQIILRIAKAYGVTLPVSEAELPPGRVAAPAKPITVAQTHALRVGLHISARKPSQRWPVASFAALARRIQLRGAVTFSVFWSPGAVNNALHPGDDDKATALRVLLAATTDGAKPTEAEFVQTNDLASLIAALNEVDILVCADGGAMHIAAGLGKPIVALFGDSDPIRWRPWGVPHRVLQAPTRDVSAIAVSTVLDVFDELAAKCGFGAKSDGAKSANMTPP